ncbi:MAG: hypothetical protein KKA31_05710, partial [Candidatus Margulisbacteria bacterium]|nr:hypothetical protein [Candidatus Margulisiibacteriota bacterium]
MKNIRIVCLSALVALMFALPSLAGPPQVTPPYPTAFWIYGELVTGQEYPPAGPKNDYKVVFYGVSNVPSLEFAFDMSDNAGNFIINAHDDLRLLPLNEDQEYYIGVVAKDIDGQSYGANQRGVTLTADDLVAGYKNVDVNLRQGEGIPDPEGIEEVVPIELGTFWIDRVGDGVGDDIKIGWDPEIYSDPTIYAMIGNGTGQFQNTIGDNVWTEIYSNSKLNSANIAALELGTVSM